MKRLALAALALPAWLGAAVQIRNLTFDTPLDTVYSGQVAVSHFEIMTAPGTQAYFAVAIAPGAAMAPGATADWIIDQVGTYNSSKAAPTNACPQTGYPGPTQGAYSAWLPVTASFRMPNYPSCAPKKYFVVAYEGPLMDACSYGAILSQAFTANDSGCPTATPTRTPTAPAATPTRTPTATPGIASPTATPTAGSPPATPTRTPTAGPAASGPAAEPIRIVRALMVPNPNPSKVFFDLRGAPDEIRVSLYTSSYAKAWETTVPGSPAGWRSVQVPPPAASGTYFVKVEALAGGAVKSSFACVAAFLR